MISFSVYDIEIKEKTGFLLPYDSETDTSVGFAGSAYSSEVEFSQKNSITIVFKATNTPIRPQTISVTAKGYLFPNLDDGYGNILGKGLSGSVNYVTGLITVTFASVLPENTEVTIQYSQDFEGPEVPTVPGKEVTIRFDNNITTTLKFKKEQFDRMNASADGLEFEVLKLLKKKVKKEMLGL